MIDYLDANDIIAAMEKSPAQFKEEFCKRLQHFREARGLSQPDMAQRLKIPASTYSSYESRTPLPHHFVPKTLRILGVTLDELYGLASPEPHATAIAEPRTEYGIDVDLINDIRTNLDRQLARADIKLPPQKYRLAIAMLYERSINNPSDADAQTARLIALLE